MFSIIRPRFRCVHWNDKKAFNFVTIQNYAFVWMTECQCQTMNLLSFVDVNDAFGNFDEWIAREKSLLIDVIRGLHRFRAHRCVFPWTRWQNAAFVLVVTQLSLTIRKTFDGNFLRLPLIMIRVGSCRYGRCRTFAVWYKQKQNKKWNFEPQNLPPKSVVTYCCRPFSSTYRFQFSNDIKKSIWNTLIRYPFRTIAVYRIVCFASVEL